MPLPAALLKRLSQRGIVNDASKKPAPKERAAPPEEIIAEDYDDDDQEPPNNTEFDYQNAAQSKKPNFWSERLKRRIVDGTINAKGYRACPNKYNVHHKCAMFCINKYGEGIREPDEEYLRRKQRLLRKYPLPSEWQEVYDEGCGVHFYWNTFDDTVSWLPPLHPQAVISKSAATLRREIEAAAAPQNDYDDNSVEPKPDRSNFDQHVESSYANAPKEPPPKPMPSKKPRDSDRPLHNRNKHDKRPRRDPKDGALDPMDPAAYSDIPRGKWSAGLESENNKGGVDSSVSGTLFQMRPYPSPGAILQANARKAKADKNSDASDDSDPNPEN